MRFSDDERFAVASAIRDWIHEQPWSECGPGADTCLDWFTAFAIRDIALTQLESGPVVMESDSERHDGAMLVAWIREGADEIESAHHYLDVQGVPRRLPGAENECTLAARIAMAVRS